MKSDQLNIMLGLQDMMNKKVHPEWQTQNFAWGRAIMVEAVEALEHHGWKWWKKQEPDMAQVRLELVDIWHFILSHFIEHYQHDAAETVRARWSDGSSYWVERSVQSNLETLIRAGASGGVHMPSFVALLHQCELDWDELVKLYIAKNVLNMFRQKHGYKDGTYIKNWNGKEDNQVLMQLIEANPSAEPSKLLLLLGKTYNEITGVKL